jgi:uncharacterized protein YjiK
MTRQRRRAFLRISLATAVAAAGAPALTAPADASAAAAARPTLVRTVNTARFTPSSPDPSGITFLQDRDRLFISDCDVDEQPSYARVNLWETTRTGATKARARTTRISSEPTGLSYRRSNRHLFISDDNTDEIYDVTAGRDGKFWTDDDAVTSFDTRAAGNTDPEDVAVNTHNGQLFVVDETAKEVFVYAARRNVRRFDVAKFDATGPEGIAYDASTRTLLVLDQGSHTVFEVTTAGRLVRKIDISAAPTVNASGITLAPASNGSRATHMYITDRGIDNSANPRENDGKLFEMTR